jgi:hypothetical protein
MNMELNEIKLLLAKFYEGSTSLEEEHSLRDYFRDNTVPEELATDRELFMYSLNEAKLVPMNSGLEKKLEHWIDLQDAGEKKTRHIQLWYKVASVAAGIAILVVCYLFIVKQDNEIKPKDTYTDPQIAYAQVKQTLLYISEKLNKGTKPLNQMSKLNQGMEHFSSFSSFGSGLKQLEMSSYYDQTSNENNKN